jgi:hypothetical protein
MESSSGKALCADYAIALNKLGVPEEKVNFHLILICVQGDRIFINFSAPQRLP